MRLDRSFSNLIGRIYDCALDTSLWNSALRDITEALGGRMADIVVSHPLERQQRIAVLYNWPDEMAALAQANAPLNPALPVGLTAPLCEPVCSSRDFGIEAFHSSRYWAACYAGSGIYDYIAVPIQRSVTTFASWGVAGDETKGVFGDEDLELARLLSPHIKRSVDISGVLGRQRVEAGTLRAALETLASAAVIIEPDGAILFGNEAAWAELSRGQIFRERRQRLVASTPEGQKLMATLSSSAQRAKQKGLDAHLTDPTGRTLHVTWAVLEQAGEELGSPILLLLREPETALETPLSIAAGRYHLTVGETQVLAQLLQGRTLAETAEILGVARSTVKTHLDAIYRKSQTRRQAELVSRIMSFTSPLRR